MPTEIENSIRAAAEKVAQRAVIGGESDGLLKVLSILKRGR